VGLGVALGVALEDMVAAEVQEDKVEETQETQETQETEKVEKKVVKEKVHKARRENHDVIITGGIWAALGGSSSESESESESESGSGSESDEDEEEKLFIASMLPAAQYRGDAGLPRVKRRR
jgi:hypothetical protein